MDRLVGRRALIRADGTVSSGLGHLVRALSVAQAARAAGWGVTLCGEITSEAGTALVASAGFKVMDPAMLLRSPQDDGETKEHGGDLQDGDSVNRHSAVGEAESQNPFATFNIIHVDSYVIGLDWKGAVNAAGALYSRLEDGVFGRAPADLVFDTFIGSDTPGSVTMTRPDDGSAVFRGVQYAPMRQEVLEARAQRNRRSSWAGGPCRDHGPQVLVAMGGTDLMNAAGTIAEICAAAPSVGRVTVVAPPERWEEISAHVSCAKSQDLGSLATCAQGSARVELVPTGLDFLERVATSDLVVCTASTTVLEVACIGTPAVVVAVVDNQEQTYADVVGLGYARGLGMLADVQQDPQTATAIIDQAAQDLAAGQSWSAQHLVDGRGAERIVAEWNRALGHATNAQDSDFDACDSARGGVS